MRILKQDKQSVTVEIGEAKARDLLAGLLAHPELGDIATELAEQLKANGIEPAAGDGHIRYEHAPPLTH